MEIYLVQTELDKFVIFLHKTLVIGGFSEYSSEYFFFTILIRRQRLSFLLLFPQEDFFVF